jgi:hypothetical protein
VSGNGVFGPENGRSVDTSYIRVFGGTIATGGANLLVFGNSHASAPGRAVLAATGTGYAELSTFAGSARLDASGNFSVDTNTLFVDAANNRVGVGTATPTSTLEVAGGAARISGNESSVSLFLQTAIRHTGSGGWFLDANTGGVANSITIRNGSGFATMAEFSASGNLGLGVTPSGWDSGKAFEIGVAGNAMWSSAGSLNLTQNAAFASAAYRYLANATAARYHLNGNVHEWYTAASGTAGNAISFTQALTLDASGNLLVGLTTGSYRLMCVVASGADRDVFQAGITGASNGLSVKWNHSTTKTHVSIADIPTSSAGLPAGTLYSDGGTIKIA